MKLVISRKVKFRTSEKADSIINQYNLEGDIEEIEFILNHIWVNLNKEFTQTKKERGK